MEAPSPKHLIHGAIFLLANRLQMVGDQVMGDITSKQWFALLAVAQWPGMPRVTDIAAEIGTSRQNAAKLLEQLAQKGYAAFLKNEEDHRSRRVCLTAKGKTRMPQISAEGERSLQRLFEGVQDADIATAGRVLLRLFENAGEMQREDAPHEKE